MSTRYSGRRKRAYCDGVGILRFEGNNRRYVDPAPAYAFACTACFLRTPILSSHTKKGAPPDKGNCPELEQ
jgi:hypothetical protein